MKSLLLLAFVVLANIPTALSSQKPLEITCDYYKTHNKNYDNDFLVSENIEYGNEKENNFPSTHDYWVDLNNQKVLTRSFTHIKLQPMKQGDLLVLSGERLSDGYPVDTVKISINLSTMEADVSHKQVHIYSVEPEDLGSNHHLFLDGKCRYQPNALDQDPLL